jgi:hypothetical protein
MLRMNSTQRVSDNVKFLQKNRKLGMVEDVYYISEIKNNILSVGQLMKKGLKSS